VSPVRYELDVYIPEDDIFHSNRRENLKSCIRKLPSFYNPFMAVTMKITFPSILTPHVLVQNCHRLKRNILIASYVQNTEATETYPFVHPLYWFPLSCRHCQLRANIYPASLIFRRLHANKPNCVSYRLHKLRQFFHVTLRLPATELFGIS
jgi:hypothetical protein